MLQIAFGPQTSFFLHGSETEERNVDFKQFSSSSFSFLNNTLTLVVNARLRRRAIFVASTSQDARSVDASLIGLTLRMGDTGNHALIVSALFTRRAISSRSANSYNQDNFLDETTRI